MAVHHDADGDGAMERGLFGLPSEPYGISNGARRRFGPPRRRDAAFGHGGRGTAVAVRVR